MKIEGNDMQFTSKTDNIETQGQIMPLCFSFRLISDKKSPFSIKMKSFFTLFSPE